MKIDLRKCKKGDKLRLRNWEVAVYLLSTSESHLVHHKDAAVAVWHHNDGRPHDSIHPKVIEIITNKTMTEAEKNAKIEDIEQQLKELRETPTAPRLELKDKHVYRREDGEILFAFKHNCGFNLVGQESGLKNLPDPDKYGQVEDCPPIVECIGRIGVVDELDSMSMASGIGGLWSSGRVHHPDKLTGKKI